MEDEAGPKFDPNGIEARLCTTIAPMMLTLAAFLLTTAGSSQESPERFPIAMLYTAALVAVLIAALLIDNLLDKLEISWPQRWSYLGGGYLLFSAIIAVLAWLIPVLHLLRFDKGDSVCEHYIGFGLALVLGGITFAKVMTMDRNAVLTVIGAVLAIANGVWIAGVRSF